MKFLKTEEKRENISKDIDRKASKKVFINLIIAIAIMAYFCTLSIVYKNVGFDVIVDVVKVTTMVFLAISLILLEIAYKKESRTFVIHAFEILALAIHSLTTMHITKLNNFDFNNYILISSYAFSIYYVLKTIIITTKAKKEFLNGLSDISDIVQKDEPSKKEASKKDKKKDKKQKNEEINETVEKNETVETENSSEEKAELNEELNTNEKLAKLRDKIKRLQEEDKKLHNSIKKEEKVENNAKIEEDKKSNEASKENKNEEEKAETPKAKKRGRPKKETTDNIVESPKPKKRGRPKKEVKVND